MFALQLASLIKAALREVANPTSVLKRWLPPREELGVQVQAAPVGLILYSEAESNRKSESTQKEAWPGNPEKG